MADTSYYVRCDRYTRQAATVDRYSMTGVAPAVATAFRKLKFTSAWSPILRESVGNFPSHTGNLTDGDRLYDAYAFCGDHDAVTGQHRAFVGCVAYRVMLPSAFYSTGVNIKSVTVTINGDPYLFDGARVAVVNNGTATPDADWANITTGSVYAASVAKRTSAVVGGVTKWYPTTETKTLVLNANGIQATQYLWIYLSLEDYTKAHRVPWIEGGAALSPDIYVTFTNAVPGYTAGTDIGGTEPLGEIAANQTSIWRESRSYVYTHNTLCPPSDGTTQGKLNAMMNCFVEQCSLITSPGYAGTSYYARDDDSVGFNAGVTWGNSGANFANGTAIFASVVPVLVDVPAFMKIRKVKIAAPPTWADLTFRVCAFIIDGSYTEESSRIVPHNDAGFWFGTSKTVSIAGKTATLLGYTDIDTASEIIIPVSDFAPYSTDTKATIYITLTPIEVTASCTTNGGSRRIGYVGCSFGTTAPYTPSPTLVSTINGYCYPWTPTYVKITD